MDDTHTITPADELISRYLITDGLVFAVDVNPLEIVIDCAFDTYVSKDKWTRQPACIHLKEPSGCDLAFQYPNEVGLVYAGDLGSFNEVRASGPLEVAEFFLAFTYGAIRVSRCILSIEALSWDEIEAKHPWLKDEHE